MPTDNRAWTQEQGQKIIAWLNEKWGQDRPCSQCGHSEWGIGQSPVQLIVGGPDGGIFLGESYPCVPILCNNCGNTVLINALKCGVQSSPIKKETENG